jgi:hypothetical protein
MFLERKHIIMNSFCELNTSESILINGGIKKSVIAQGGLEIMCGLGALGSGIVGDRKTGNIKSTFEMFIGTATIFHGIGTVFDGLISR